MNSELLREREAFKRKAMAVPVIENKASSNSGPSGPPPKQPKKSEKMKELGAQSLSAQSKLDMAHMRSLGGQSSAYKFGVLTKIVRHMKARHMAGEDQPLTLEDILDETRQLDVTTKVKQWLANEALNNNPKISASPSMTTDGPATTYLFKPPFDISTRKGLLRLLERYDRQGLGGIFMEDLQESLPRCEKIINILLDQDRIIVINRGADKKKVVFLRDISEKMQFNPNEEFQRLWRSVAVGDMDDNKIEDYLYKTGFAVNAAQKKIVAKKPARKRANRRRGTMKDNDHMKDVLVNYDEMTAESNKVK